MAAGLAIGGPADSDFSPAQSVFSGLGGGGSPAYRAFARPATRYPAASGRSEAAAGQAGPGFSSSLHLRNSLVRRNLLLDLPHHAPVRRGRHAGRAGAALSFLPLPGPLSRPLRLADRTAGKGRRGNKPIQPPGAGSGPGSLGCRGTGPHPHHRLSLGPAGRHPGGQYSAGPHRDAHWPPLSSFGAKGAKAANGNRFCWPRPLP